MKIFPKQRGQTVVEFSLILPILALLLFAMIYMGFFLLDYITLTAAADDAAHDAAINNGTISNGVRTKVQGTPLFLPWYEMDITSATPSPWVLQPGETGYDPNFVTVKIQVNMTEDVRDNFFLSFLPPNYPIFKAAYIGTDENNTGDGNGGS